MTDVKHKFTSGKAAAADPSLVDGPKWDDVHVFSGGQNGQVPMRDSAFDPPAGNGARWAWPVVGNSIAEGLIVEAAHLAATATLRADRLAVEGVLLSNLNLTGNIQTNGANGLDAGSAGPSEKWYAVYVITDDLGTQSALLFSLSATTPTLPPGYTKKRRVGWQLATDVFRRHIVQRGPHARFLAPEPHSALLMGTTFQTNTNFADRIPPGIRRILGAFRFSISHSNENQLFSMFVRPAGQTHSGATIGSVEPVSPTQSSWLNVHMEIEVDANRHFDTAISLVPDQGSTFQFQVTGWYDDGVAT